MWSFLRDWLVRHEPQPSSWHASIKSGTGGVIGIAAAGALATATGIPFLLAPFGATAVLIFGQPASPLAQPINVIGGYLAATLVAATLMICLPHVWWAAALGVGSAIALMLALRITHPPAGAIPIVAASSTLSPSALLGVVIAGSIGLVAIAALHHRLPPTHPYPRRTPRPD